MAYCDMCGKETRVLFTINVEGASLDVCESCSGKNEVLNKKIDFPEPRPKKEAQERDVPEEIVCPDYADVLKKAVDSKQLTLKELGVKCAERKSILQKVITGKMPPSLVLARKLEKVLDVSLIEKETDYKAAATKTKSEGMTIGDIIKIKKP